LAFRAVRVSVGGNPPSFAEPAEGRQSAIATALPPDYFHFCKSAFFFKADFTRTLQGLFCRRPSIFDLQIVSTVGSPFSAIHAIMPA
jgi:hypothetical protein